MKNQNRGGDIAKNNRQLPIIEPINNKLEKTNKNITDGEGNVILDEMDQECIYLKNTIQEQMIYGRSVITLEEIENTTFTIGNDQLIASNNFGLAIQGYFDNDEHNAFDDYRKAVGKFSENELDSLKNEALKAPRQLSKNEDATSYLQAVSQLSNEDKESLKEGVARIISKQESLNNKRVEENRITGLDKREFMYEGISAPSQPIAIGGGDLDKPFVQRVAGIDSKVYNSLFHSFDTFYSHTRVKKINPIDRIKKFVINYLEEHSYITKFAYLSYSGAETAVYGSTTIGDSGSAQISTMKLEADFGAVRVVTGSTGRGATHIAQGDEKVTLQYFDIPNEKKNWSNFKYMMIFNAIILKEIMNNIEENYADFVNLVFRERPGDKKLSTFIKNEIPSCKDGSNPKCKISKHFEDNADTLIMPFEYTLVCNGEYSNIDYKVFIGDILVNKGDGLTFNGFNDKPDNNMHNIGVIIKTLIEAYKFKIAYTKGQADNLKNTSNSQIFLKVKLPKEYHDETLKIPTYRIGEKHKTKNELNNGIKYEYKGVLGTQSSDKPDVHDVPGLLLSEVHVKKVPKQTTTSVKQITYYNANNEQIEDKDVNKFNQNQQYYVPCNGEKPPISHKYTLDTANSIADVKYYKYNNIFNHMADNGNILPEDKPTGRDSNEVKQTRHSDNKKNLHTIAGITSQLIYQPSTLIENLNININTYGTMVSGKDGRYTESWEKEADNGKWRLLGLYQDDPDSPFVSDKDNKCIKLHNKERAKRLYYRVGAWYRIDASDVSHGGRAGTTAPYRIKATLMITHRGSVSWRDWAHDDAMISMGLGQMNSRIHDFYWNILPEIVSDMNEQIQKVVGSLDKVTDSVNVSTYVSGHSLGGYLALSTAKNSIYDARPGTGTSNTTWAANKINKINKNTEKGQKDVNIEYVNYIYPIVMNPFLGASNKDAVKISSSSFGKIFDDFLHSIPSGDLYHVYNPYELSVANLVNKGWDNASERLDIFNVKHIPTYDKDSRYEFEEIQDSYGNNSLVFHNIENVVHVAGPDYGGLGIKGYMAHAHGVHQFIGLTNNNIINPSYDNSIDSDEYLYFHMDKDTKKMVKVNKTGIYFSKATRSHITGGKKKSKTNKKNTRIRHKKMNKKTLKKGNKKSRRKKQTRRKIKKRTRKYRK